MYVFEVAKCCHAVSGRDAGVSAPGLAVLCSNVFAVTLPLLESGLCLLCLLLQLLLVLPGLCQLTFCRVMGKQTSL
jgi:hypothetical protein